MKILLIGKNGQLGWELNRSMLHLGQIVALDRKGLDLSQPGELRASVRKIKPDVIVNTAAYTAVDEAEEDEALAMMVNGTAPGVLAEEAERHGALLVHFSTDYVFDGTNPGPYTESDVPNPVNAYGRSKLAGEQGIMASGCDYLIFRTSWVYASRGKNFFQTILRLANERSSISVVDDQYGAPTWARLIAAATSCCIGEASKQRKTGEFRSELLHLASAGSTTWHGFAEAIVETAIDRLSIQPKLSEIQSISTAEYNARAPRPINSRLSCRKLESNYGLVMPDWKNCLALCIDEVKTN